MAEKTEGLIRRRDLRNPQESMLAPIAYSEAVMPALRLTQSSRGIRRIANYLMVGLGITIVLMAFAPWQQSVPGSGSVLAFSPFEREQVIEAPTKGRLVPVGEPIYENMRVEKGRIIAEIQNLADNYLGILEMQRENMQMNLEHTQSQLEAEQQAVTNSSQSLKAQQDVLESYRDIKQYVMSSQDAFVKEAEEKLNVARQKLAENEAAIFALEEQKKRIDILAGEGNISIQKQQETSQKLMEARAKVQQAKSYVDSQLAAVEAKKQEREAKVLKAQADIEAAQSKVEDASSYVAIAQSKVAKTQQMLEKAKKDLADADIKLTTQNNQVVRAPIDGFLTQITPNFGTGILKEGSPICTIVPDTTDRSVQVWLNGNDAPLVEPGDHVRLQFEGWPALQFAGWPSVAVGTFGGEVVSIDATDNGKGRFRVLIQPEDQEGFGSPEWPDGRFLRQGVRANAWVLLDRVPLWFEVWRRLNGFPPVVDVEEKIPKAPKLPK